MKKKFIIVVPARYGSKSIKNKNIIKINSIPMISYTFEKIKSLKIPKFVLSNDQRVLNIAKKYNYDYIVLLQPTSPIRDQKDIINSINKVKKDKLLKLTSLSKSLEHPYETVYLKNKTFLSFFPKKSLTRRQDFDRESYFINGSLYIYHKSIIEGKKINNINKNGFYIMKKINSFDIDDYEDLEIVRKIFKK